MTGDDLQEVWRRSDAQLASVLRFTATLVRRSSLGETQTALGRLTNVLRGELVLDALAVFLIGGFTADHVREPAVLAAGASLDVYAIAIAIAVVVQLVAVSRIDYDEPVMTIARAVDRLRLLRARAALGTLLFAPLMWPPLLVVALRGFFGPGTLAALDLPWLAANVAFGLAVLGLGLGFARYGPVPAPSSPLGRVLESLSGRAVRAAADALDTLQRYETEA